MLITDTFEILTVWILAKTSYFNWWGWGQLARTIFYQFFYQRSHENNVLQGAWPRPLKDIIFVRPLIMVSTVYSHFCPFPISPNVISPLAISPPNLLSGEVGKGRIGIGIGWNDIGYQNGKLIGRNDIGRNGNKPVSTPCENNGAYSASPEHILDREREPNTQRLNRNKHLSMPFIAWFELNVKRA